MVSPIINAISLCSGVGMLDEGARAAFRYLGIDLRTVAYAEWEAPAATQLIALMEAGCLDEAPVWCGDFRKFDADSFRGKVDCIAAGFPCQDLSVAGKRAGLDGARSGLFFNVLDVADDSGAWFLVLENVAGIASATATVVDQAAATDITGERYRPRSDDPLGKDGSVLERAAARVLGELADRGWDAEWITLSASDVGASHIRERWFCIAWRKEMANPGLRNACWPEHLTGASRPATEYHFGRSLLDDAKREQCVRQRIHTRSRAAGSGTAHFGRTSEPLDNTDRARCDRARLRTEAIGEGRQCLPGPGCSDLADTCEQGSSLAQFAEPGGARRWHKGGATSELRGAPLFAPGPADPRWPSIIDACPWLAPAIADSLDEPERRRLNPRFGEWLMGWPIGWTEDLHVTTKIAGESDQQESCEEASAACGVAGWREMLQVRLGELFNEASPRLLEAGGCRNTLREMPPEPPCQQTNENVLRDMQHRLSAREAPRINAVRECGMSKAARQNQCRKAMGSRAHRLRQIGNGVVALQAATAFVEILRRSGLAVIIKHELQIQGAEA